MKLAVVGVGEGGSRIVNQVLAVEAASGRSLCDGNVLLVNSTRPEFDATEHVPEERRLTIGDVQWRVDGAGIDGDPDVAAEAASEERNEIVRAFDLIEFHEVDGVLVVAGLAGGTGGGAGAVVVDQLKDICDEPVYGVGVLPRASEGQRRAMNAARSLRSFVELADNVVVFDNDAWSGQESNDAAPPDRGSRSPDAGDETGAIDGEGTVDGEGTDATAGTNPTGGAGAPAEVTAGAAAETEDYAALNEALAERLVTLFAAGEFGGGSVSENRLDPSDIVRTLDTGGVSSIGYASIELEGTGRLRSWIRSARERLPWSPDRDADGEEVATDAARINRLVRQAARSKLTVPCEVSSADRALIVLSGPSRTLSRKGFESGRYWLEEEADVVDVMAGDEPHDRAGALTAVVLFSNVTDVPRIDAMQAQAVDDRPSPSAGGMQYGQANPP